MLVTSSAVPGGKWWEGVAVGCPVLPLGSWAPLRMTVSTTLSSQTPYVLALEVTVLENTHFTSDSVVLLV